MSHVLYLMTHHSLGPSLQIGLQPGNGLANKAVMQLKPPDHYVVVDSVKDRTEVGMTAFSSEALVTYVMIDTFDVVTWLFSR